MSDARFVADMLRAFGGLLVWVVHFGVLYGATGLACARGFESAIPWTIGIATVAALGACGAFLLFGRRTMERDLLGWLTPATAFLAIIAILWQSLPVLMVPACG